MTRKAWEAAARRTILSEKIELKAAPGLVFRARKYSIDGEDAIRAVQLRKREMVPPEIREIIMKAAATGASVSEVARELDPKEAERLLMKIPPEVSSQTDVQRARLLYGIGEHNFTDDESFSDSVTTELVDRLMDYRDLAEEIIEAVEAWNRPLADEKPAKFPTSPNGDTAEAGSSGENGSQTGAAPPS